VRAAGGAGSLVLFTRDLRVHDNAALAAAQPPVLALFVFDTRLLAGPAGAARRVAFLLESLDDLRSSLGRRGAQLVFRTGDPAAAALTLAREQRLAAVHASADHGPWALARQRALAAGCRELGIQLVLHAGVAACAPGELSPSGRDHYRVFTPYWRAWSVAAPRPRAAAPRALIAVDDVDGGEVPASLRRRARGAGRQRGGEKEAHRLLRAWLSGPIAQYDEARRSAAERATSHLGAHLHFGTISAATVLAALPEGDGPQQFARQLCWRDFFLQLLAASPSLAREDYRRAAVPWRSDPGALAAWQEGRTGYPIVDAAMRQLARDGHIHNRLRLLVASFLTRRLQLDWRDGARHFARELVDADVANNCGNWQWAAGTGTDRRPGRILNPLRQGRLLDPRGDYVRRHVPELAHLAGPVVHEPWRLPSRARPASYPPPIVAVEGARG